MLRTRHLLIRSGQIASTLVALGIVCLPFVSPASAAYICPSCYKLDRATDHVFVDRTMSADDRARLQEVVARATADVIAFYGSFGNQPTLLVCSTDECDHRLGGRGAAAVTYGTTFIRVSPRGVNETILSHEFSHVYLHGRIGPIRFLRYVPAWFDEGLAVIVSNDTRYLKHGDTAKARCPEVADDTLPSSPRQWRHSAGLNHQLYAQAACRVLQWMEANGGKDGLLMAISGVASGDRSFP